MSNEGGDGKVVRPQFGKPRNALQPQQGATEQLMQPAAVGTTAPDDAAFYRNNQDRILQVTRTLVHFDSFIHALRGYTQKQTNVALRRQGLRGVQLELLIGYIERSSEREWKAQPSYYKAVFEEISARINALRPQKSEVEFSGLTDRARVAGVAVKEDCLYLVTNGATVGSANVTADTATNYIFDELGDFMYDREDLELRRQGLKQHRLEDLVSIMNAGGRKEWAAHPHFYGAVILELNDRLVAVRKLLGLR